MMMIITAVIGENHIWQQSLKKINGNTGQH